MEPARITSFLVKIASRCNLDCDYCYVYHHADQSWRAMPARLSGAHQVAFAERLAEYAGAVSLRRASVILHGGEPLLAGVPAIIEFARMLRRTVAPDTALDIGMQTNGLLLTEAALGTLADEGISVSLSMDGPRVAQDLHRTSRKGRSSFDRVASALQALKKRPDAFAGVIAVIDPAVSPRTLLDYFAAEQVPKLDFLLPDSHHRRQPPGRDLDATLYERWLVDAFDLWLDEFPEVPVRTFEALLDAVAGLPSTTDAFGFGDVSLVTLETDGTWHDLDVLKVVGDGSTRLAGRVTDTSIMTLAASPELRAHRELLRREGLSERCRTCDVADVCGGGSVPHRFDGQGFRNPTVYCHEMKSLVAHVRRRLSEELQPATARIDEAPAFDIGAFELAETSRAIVDGLHRSALDGDSEDLRLALAGRPSLAEIDLDATAIRRLASRAGTVAWQRAARATLDGRSIHDVEGRPLESDDSYMLELLRSPRREGLEIALDDDWLRRPFGEAITFETGETVVKGRVLVERALRIIEEWRPAVAAELRTICSAVQFVRDPSADPEKIVSFSDDSVPGALFVSVSLGGDTMIDAYDLADSLVHEYRHQKLYLFERRHPTTRPGALVTSPWRDDPRPVAGLLHAVFVFVELRRFWEHVRERGPARLGNRAGAQLEETERNLAAAYETLRGCELTKAGRALTDLLESRARSVALAA